MQKNKKKFWYRGALVIGIIGLFLIFWANGAIGIIGSENNPANLMYNIIFVIAIIGSLLSRFKAKGMAITFLIIASVQLLIPFFALYVWPAKVSRRDAGVIGVLIFNTIFALFPLLSSGLFRYVRK